MPEESLQRQWLYQVRLEPLCLMLVIKGEDMFDVMRERKILTVKNQAVMQCYDHKAVTTSQLNLLVFA